MRVESAERSGVYRVTTLPAVYASHPDTLIALQMNGVRLSADHGFPARLIAPNRPGVLQTKWVNRLEVLTMNRRPLVVGDRALRAGLVVVGVLGGLVGAYAFVTGVPVRQWLGVGSWLAGGVVVHDALIAPLAVVLGLLVTRKASPRIRRLLRTALLAGATVGVLLIPLLATGGVRS